MSISNVQFTAKTPVATISVANPNLDGTGAMVPVITGAENGTSISTVTIKAMESTVEGMVRFFVKAGDTIYLIKEVRVPAVKQTGVVPAFSKVVGPPLIGFKLETDWILYASTEKKNTFKIIADAADWEYVV